MRSRIGAIMAVAISMMLALASPALGDQLMSKTEFRDRFIAEVHKLASGVTIKVKSEQQVELSQPGGETADSYLGNAYADYLRAPDTLDSLITGYAKVAIESMKSVGRIQVRDLVTLVRPKSYVAFEDKEKVVRSLAGDLVRVLAVNTPDSFQIPTLEQLSKSVGAPDDKLWSKALDNTKALIGDCSASKLSEGVSDLQCNPAFASSALLLDEIWAPHKIPGRGAAIVAVGKNDLLVAHSGAPKSVEALSGFLAAHADDPSFLSATLLMRTGDGWATYAPDP